SAGGLGARYFLARAATASRAKGTVIVTSTTRMPPSTALSAKRTTSSGESPRSTATTPAFRIRSSKWYFCMVFLRSFDQDRIGLADPLYARTRPVFSPPGRQGAKGAGRHAGPKNK